MSSSAARKLADQLFDMLPDPVAIMRPLWAVVKATQTGPPHTVVIQITGATTLVSGVRYNATYTPTIGDTVYGRIAGTDMLVEGKCAS